MAGTRTAPDFTSAASERNVSMGFVDASGDSFSISLDGVPITVTDQQVEDLADAIQAATQSSLYSITDSFVYRGVKASSNAESGTRDSVADGINVLYRNATGSTATLRVIAPVAAVMVGNTDAVDVADALLLAVNTAFEAAATGYTAESAQYTERRERSSNPRDSF